MAAILMLVNKGRAAMFVSQTNPSRIELYSYANNLLNFGLLPMLMSYCHSFLAICYSRYYLCSEDSVLSFRSISLTLFHQGHKRFDFVCFFFGQMTTDLKI